MASMSRSRIAAQQRADACSAAASPAAITSAASSGTGLMPAARLVASEMPSTSIPTWRAAIASSTVDMPTRSAPIVAAMRISAGVSKCGPWKPEVHALRQVGVDGAGEVAQPGAVEVGQVDERATERRGGLAPVSGDRPVRLMWSLISTGWPTDHSAAQRTRRRW